MIFPANKAKKYLFHLMLHDAYALSKIIFFRSSFSSKRIEQVALEISHFLQKRDLIRPNKAG